MADVERQPDGRLRFSAILDRMERYTPPEERAEVCFYIESVWCWSCGNLHDECTCPTEEAVDGN